MKSMLQDLDNNQISKDDLIHAQNGKLADKDKIIQNNKTELERLEKKNRMQEHKVTDENTRTSQRMLSVFTRYVTQFL